MACLRLKRLLEEDPVDAIVVSHKRRCLDRGDAPDQEIKTVFKFVGTVRSKNECVEPHLSKAIGQENGAILNRKRRNEHIVDPAKKSKVESLLISKQNSFKLVRTSPASDKESTDLENTVKGLCQLFDAEQDDVAEHKTQNKAEESEVITCNGTPLQRENATSEEVEYVYDLYYSDVQDYSEEEMLKASIRIEYCALDFELQQDQEVEEADVNDEDSNDESDWRNDYPDEDEFENDDEENGRDGDESISEQMASFGLGNGSYNEDSSGGEVDSEDERRYGRAFAKFRARIKVRHEEDKDEEDDDDDDDEDNGILHKGRSGNPFAG